MGGLLALFFPLLPKATGEIGTIDNYGAEGPRDPVPPKGHHLESY